MNAIHDHMTPSRLRFLTELERLGIGEPYVRGTTRHHLLKLGWIEGVYLLPDGREVPVSEFDKMFPPGTDRYRGVKFRGVTLTARGREWLRADHQ